MRSRLPLHQVVCRLAVLVATMVLASTGALRAQLSDSTSGRPAVGGAATFGVGTGTLGIAMLGSLDLRIHGHLITARVSATAELFGDEVWDAAVLYGRLFPTGDFSLEGSAGVGVALGEEGGSIYNEGTALDPRIGLALQAGGFWRPTSFLALGVIGFGNINGGHTFGGAVAGVRIGYF